MTKNNYIIIGAVIAVLAVLLYWYIPLQSVTTTQQQQPTPSLQNVPSPTASTGTTTQLPNPASTHCTDALSGTLKIVDTADGQIGICNLPDGRRCEEWDLFRTGNCTLPPGQGSTTMGKGGD